MEQIEAERPGGSCLEPRPTVPSTQTPWWPQRPFQEMYLPIPRHCPKSLSTNGTNSGSDRFEAFLGLTQPFRAAPSMSTGSHTPPPPPPPDTITLDWDGVQQGGDG